MTEAELQAETTRRYRECLADGGHRSSGRVISRYDGMVDYLPMTICARCGVPYAVKRRGYNGRLVDVA